MNIFNYSYFANGYVLVTYSINPSQNLVHRSLFSHFWPVEVHPNDRWMIFFFALQARSGTCRCCTSMFFGAAGEVQNIERVQQLIPPLKNCISSFQIRISHGPEAKECSVPHGRHPPILHRDPHGQAVNVFFRRSNKIPTAGPWMYFFRRPSAK